MSDLIPTTEPPAQLPPIPDKSQVAHGLADMHFWTVVLIGIAAGLLAKHASSISKGETVTARSAYSDAAMIPMNAFIVKGIVDYYPNMSETMIILVASTLAITGARYVPLVLASFMRYIRFVLKIPEDDKTNTGS